MQFFRLVIRAHYVDVDDLLPRARHGRRDHLLMIFYCTMHYVICYIHILRMRAIDNTVNSLVHNTAAICAQVLLCMASRMKTDRTSRCEIDDEPPGVRCGSFSHTNATECWPYERTEASTRQVQFCEQNSAPFRRVLTAATELERFLGFSRHHF